MTICVELIDSGDISVVIVAALVVVGQGASGSPLSKTSSVFVDLSAMVHFVIITGINLQRENV